MQKVSRSIFAGLLLVAGLTACGDKVTVTAPSGGTSTTSTPVVHSVTVSPASVSLKIGETVQLVASVDADAGLARTVTWKSGDAAKATVSSSGLVTAVASGTVAISATSTADNNVVGAATIIVGSTTAATISISSINQTVGGVSAPANLANVAGQLDVTLNVDQGTQTVTKLDLIVHDNTAGTNTTVATYTFTSANKAPGAASASSAPITMSFNTAAYDTTTDIAKFFNGSYTIQAKATIAGDTTQSPVSSTMSYTLNNPDAIVSKWSPKKTATNVASGATWAGGDSIFLKVHAITYMAGRSITKVTVVADSTTGGPTAIAGKSNQFTAVPVNFAYTSSASGSSTVGLGNRTITGFFAAVSTQYDNGSAGPAANTSTINVDYQAPNAPTTMQFRGGLTTWLNAAYKFGNSTDYAAANLDGGGTPGTATQGSGLGTASFYAVANGSLPTLTGCPTTGMTLETTPASVALNQSNPADSTTYQLRVLQPDLLGNTACADFANPFGVDVTPPVNGGYATGSGLNNTADPLLAGTPMGHLSTDLAFMSVSAVDSTSGFTSTPVSQSVVRTNQAVGGIAPSPATTCVVGTGSSCALASGAGVSNSVTGGSAVEGYYRYNASIADKAGNSVSLAPANFLVAVDNTPPGAVGGVAVPAALVGGQPVSLTANIIDNLTLMSTTGSIAYPVFGGIAINYGGTISGSPVFGTLNPSATATLSVPVFISSLQTADGTGPTAASVLPTGANLRGVDEIGLTGGFQAVGGAVNINPNNNIVTGTGNGSVVGAGVTAGDWDNVNDFTSFVTSPTAAANICNASNTANCTVNNTSFTLKASVTVPHNKGLPFSQVCWFYQNTVGGLNEYQLIGCQAAAAVASGATLDVWTYTGSTFDPPAALGTGTGLTMIGIGYGVNGHAAATQNVNVTLTAN